MKIKLVKNYRGKDFLNSCDHKYILTPKNAKKIHNKSNID